MRAGRFFQGLVVGLFAVGALLLLGRLARRQGIAHRALSAPPLGRWEERLANARRLTQRAAPLLLETGILALELRRPFLGRLARELVNLAARHRS